MLHQEDKQVLPSIEDLEPDSWEDLTKDKIL